MKLKSTLVAMTLLVPTLTAANPFESINSVRDSSWTTAKAIAVGLAWEVGKQQRETRYRNYRERQTRSRRASERQRNNRARDSVVAHDRNGPIGTYAN